MGNECICSSVLEVVRRPLGNFSWEGVGKKISLMLFMPKGTKSPDLWWDHVAVAWAEEGDVQ